MTTSASDIRDILTVQGILNNYSDDGDEAEAIAALLDWREAAVTEYADMPNAPTGTPLPPLSAAVDNKLKGKPGKATESKDSFEPSPDPSEESPDF